MKKRTLISIVAVLGLMIVFFVTIKVEKEEPIIIRENALLEKLTIDEIIDRAELIVIGEVKTTSPSRWKSHKEKDAKKATPQEIFEAEGLFTDSIILVDQILKGTLLDSTVRVRTFIGETEQVRWENSSEPNYEKGKKYLLFLHKDNGPTQIVEPGDYISVNAIQGVYEIIDGKAISRDDEWVFEDLIAYIQNALQNSQ